VAHVLPRSFYARSTLTVARELIGKVLVHRTPDGLASGMIVETEAYIGEDDAACHAACGPTRRNALLYGPPGMAYVYLNYGLHHLVNAVTEEAGHPAAVLIRALQPIQNVGLMTKRRGVVVDTGETHRLCRGPGNLTRALAITLANNGMDLTAGSLRIEDRGLDPGKVSWGPRIGIRVAMKHPWRCSVVGNPSVSHRLTRA
jgi:DNA-3-methyladenine glycosylase